MSRDGHVLFHLRKSPYVAFKYRMVSSEAESAASSSNVDFHLTKFHYQNKTIVIIFDDPDRN